MATKNTAAQQPLSPSLFDATGRAQPVVVPVPPLFDPFGEAQPMSDAEYSRWLDRRDREREFAADGGW